MALPQSGIGKVTFIFVNLLSRKEFDPDKIPEDNGDISGNKLPSYVRVAPWYRSISKDAEGPEHQKIAPWARQKYTPLSEHYHREAREKTTFIYKPGCCKNCGAPTHTEFECPERPRKRNAKITGAGSGVKEVIEKHDLSYAAKHDQFANADTDLWWYKVRGPYALGNKLRSKHAVTSNPVDLTEQYGTGIIHRDRRDMPGYIKALNQTEEEENDDFVKGTAEERPQNENRYSVQEVKSDPLMESRRSIEFAQRQKLLQKQQDVEDISFAPIPKSEKYPEDVFTNGHTSVWGSYFRDGKWGYACCHQLNRDSICIAASDGQ